jgi:Tfp pilus assembly protein PilF
VQQQLTKLEIMCAQLQDENEKLIREASQHKKEQIRQCNYAFLLQTGKKELDKAEELYKKALQAEPHRPVTLFNYALLLHARGRVQEGCDIYAHAFELEPTSPFVQEKGHLFNNARLSNPVQHTRHVQTTPKTQSRRNLQAHLSKTCTQHGMPTDDQPICLLYTKHFPCPPYA